MPGQGTRQADLLAPPAHALYTAPFPAPGSPHPSGPPSGGLALSRSQVLVVDDEELYRRALERILSRVGYTVLAARDASEAMSIVSSQSLDLVLCDVQMPGINGHELVRRIHEIDPDLPCIVVTGYGSAESSIEALRAGAFWYLDKPFDHDNLDVVRRLADLLAPPAHALYTAPFPDPGTASLWTPEWRSRSEQVTSSRRR